MFDVQNRFVEMGVMTTISICYIGVISFSQVIKLFPCSTQLSTKYILPINVKMPIIIFPYMSIADIYVMSPEPHSNFTLLI